MWVYGEQCVVSSLKSRGTLNEKELSSSLVVMIVAKERNMIEDQLERPGIAVK